MERKSVLLVDHDHDARDALGLLLGAEGFATHGTASAGAAIGLLDAGLQPDLVVVDMLLPGTAGADLAALLRVHDPTRHVPLLVYSASPDVAAYARDVGASGWATKPHYERLLELVHRLA